MGKQKIADGIIIRVGGGIREVPRDPAEIAESLESLRKVPDFEKTEDVHPFGGELGTQANIGTDGIK